MFSSEGNKPVNKILQQRKKKRLCNCRAYNIGGVDSDHHIVCARFRFSVCINRDPKNQAKRVEWLESAEHQVLFSLELSNRFKALSLSNQERTVSQKYYHSLLKCIEQTAVDVLGVKQRANHPQ